MVTLRPWATPLDQLRQLQQQDRHSHITTVTSIRFISIRSSWQQFRPVIALHPTMQNSLHRILLFSFPLSIHMGYESYVTGRPAALQAGKLSSTRCHQRGRPRSRRPALQQRTGASCRQRPVGAPRLAAGPSAAGIIVAPAPTPAEGGPGCPPPVPAGRPQPRRRRHHHRRRRQTRRGARQFSASCLGRETGQWESGELGSNAAGPA